MCKKYLLKNYLKVQKVRQWHSWQSGCFRRQKNPVIGNSLENIIDWKNNSKK